jgi:hypothetical protein
LGISSQAHWLTSVSLFVDHLLMTDDGRGEIAGFNQRLH